MVRVDGIDVGDGCFCVFHCLFRRFVAKVFGTEISVHAYAADERSLPLFETDVGKQVCWSHVYCSVICSGRGAMGEGSRYTSGIDPAGFSERREG